MKRLALLLLLLASPAFAQRGNIYSTKAQEEFSKALTEGVLFGVPRYTTVALPICDATQVGALAWNTTTNTLWGCNGTAWAAVDAGGGGGVTPGGNNAFTGINSFLDGSNFSILGTADNTKVLRFSNAGMSTGQTITVATPNLVTGTYTAAYANSGNIWTVNQTYNPSAGIISSGAGFYPLLAPLTPDSGSLVTFPTSGSIHMSENADALFDFNNGPCLVASCLDPTFIIHSHNQTTTEYLAFRHTGAEALISTGAGAVEFPSQTNISGPDATSNVEIGSIANDANAGTGGTTVAIGNGANNGNGTNIVVIGAAANNLSGNSKVIIGSGTSDTSTGSGHVLIGPGATITNSNAQTVIGANATSSGTSSITIGNLAANNNGGSNIVIGNSAGGGSGGTSVVIGTSASNAGNAANTVLVGNTASNLGSGTGVIAIGQASGVTGAVASTDAIAIGRATIVGSGGGAAARAIAIGATNNASAGNDTVLIGFGLTAQSTNSVVIGNTTGAYNNVWLGGKGQLSAAATAYTINGTGGSGANNAGAALQLAGGKGTGTAVGGDVVIQRSPSIATGSTAQTLADAYLIRSQMKALTAATDTAFVRVNLAAGAAGLTGWTGGTLFYTLVSNDATDFQSLSGKVPFAVVNKAGVETCFIGTDSAEAAVASSGTNTVSFNTDTTAPTNGCDLLANATSSLTETTLALFYSVVMNGPGTLTPQ